MMIGDSARLATKDGVLFGSGHAFCWKVFAPPWWRIDRWLWWTLFETRPHGIVETSTIGRDGRRMLVERVRVVRSDVVLPNVPGPYSQTWEPGVPPDRRAS
jgi:hypothetical protein